MTTLAHPERPQHSLTAQQSGTLEEEIEKSLEEGWSEREADDNNPQITAQIERQREIVGLLKALSNEIFVGLQSVQKRINSPALRFEATAEQITFHTSITGPSGDISVSVSTKSHGYYVRSGSEQIASGSIEDENHGIHVAKIVARAAARHGDAQPM